MYRLLLAGILAAFATTTAHAASVTFNYGFSFGSVTPDGPAPFATATFDDGGTAGSVTLTMQVSPTVGLADVTELYFNLDPSLDPTMLTFTRTGGTGPTAANTTISTGVDGYRAGGDGFYDILFDFPPPPGTQAARFNAGEDLVYEISGFPALTADSFNFFSTPGPGSTAGPFLSVAKFQDTGPTQQGSDWVGAVPIPPALWLFGSGLLGLIGISRRDKASC